MQYDYVINKPNNYVNRPQIRNTTKQSSKYSYYILILNTLNCCIDLHALFTIKILLFFVRNTLKMSRAPGIPSFDTSQNTSWTSSFSRLTSDVPWTPGELNWTAVLLELDEEFHCSWCILHNRLTKGARS